MADYGVQAICLGGSRRTSLSSLFTLHSSTQDPLKRTPPSMASDPQITLFNKLMIVPVLGRTVTSALLRLVTSPLSSGPKGKTYFKDVVYAALRSMLSNIDVATEQWINAPTESTYLDFTKKAKIEPDIETLDSGLKLCWLGPKSAQKVLLYMHGG